ncbi:plasma membrane localization protein [Tulasnella sp. 418]|nr:plasma membrane localization protein [Tulasnella sp. 418]
MDMIVLPLTPNHVRLIIACYPAAPQAAAPEYRPNSQELSRLTYYASNRPGKLHKLASELEKRAKSQARKAQSGHAKGRAQLLITLEILKALTAECRKDLSAFSSGVLSSVEAALKALPNDLEVAAHAAGVFTSWTTYTDGTLLGVDEELTQEYFFILNHYAKLSVFQTDKEDLEVQNRERLVGLAALSSAIQSDALFNSMSILGRQVNVIVPALLKNIEQAGLSVLGAEATAVETYSGVMSPSLYVAEFQPTRPINQRRAPSIHAHVDGEKGPSFSDVINTVLHALRNLLAHSNALQVPIILEAAFNAFDSSESGWNNMRLCQWLVSKVTEWTQFQYRFAVPTRLLERLVDSREAPEPTNLHFALTSMITTIFTLSTPLINLSTSDVLSNLLTVIVARLNINPKDSLLPSLVECVASLATHIYYADQIQDLSEEIVNRLVAIQVNGLNGRGRSENEKGREEGLRCLVACLVGLLRVADANHQQSGKSSSKHPADVDEDAPRLIHLTANLNLIPPPMSESSGSGSGIHHSRRNKVAVEVWQDTVALLCESEFSVRNDYATALVTYLRQEIEKEPYALEDGEGSLQSRNRSNVGGPPTIPESDSITRFLHALHASCFTLAITPSLGLISNPPSTASHASSFAGLVQAPAPAPAPIHVIPPTPMGTPSKEVPADVSLNSSSPSDSPTKVLPSNSSNPNRRSIPSSVGRPRTVARGLSLLDPPQNSLLPQAPSPATASDYSLLLNILSEAYKCLPARCLFTGVPMLLAMDAAAKAETTDDQQTLDRKKAVREIVLQLWLILAKIWDCETLKSVAEEVSTFFGSKLCL